MHCHRGTIDCFAGSWGSGLATLAFCEGNSVHCNNGPLVRALDGAFGNVITDGHCVNNDAIHGKEIVYWFDEMGLCMAGFIPVDEWPEEWEDCPEWSSFDLDFETGEWEVC